VSATPVLSSDAFDHNAGCTLLSAQCVAKAFNPYRAKVGLPLLVPPKDDEKRLSVVAQSRADESWLYMYSFGIPIRELKEMFGYYSDASPAFVAQPGEFWLQPAENYWATVSDVRPGYYLLSVGGYCSSLDWESQEKMIRHRFGPRYERASEHLVCEAFFAAWLLNRWSDTHRSFFAPWERYYAHWGKALDSSGGRVCVGLSSNGIQVGSIYPEERASRLCAALVRV